MAEYLGWIGFVAIGTAVCLGAAWIWLWPRRSVAEKAPQLARERFRTQREHLEARFFQVASRSGVPRGLAWKDCDFGDEAIFVKNLGSKEFAALVPLTIAFEAIEGGGMEEVEAVHNLRAATAVFEYRDGAWTTQGRAVFNLSPDETVRHFKGQLETFPEPIPGTGSIPPC